MHRSLGRFDASDRTVFTEANGIGPWVGKLGFVPLTMLRASPDGSVWVDSSTAADEPWAECDGLAHFDGTAWRQYMMGRCYTDIDFAPDGTAWVLARGDTGLIETYVITPEIVAGSE